MRKLLCICLLSILFFEMKAQKESDYYYQIPDYPESFTAGTVTGRMVDGLGFRFYWATAGLNSEDLLFRATEQSRTLGETVDHIYNLTLILKNATEKKSTLFPVDISTLSFDEKRNAILEFVKTASIQLKGSSDEDFAQFKMVFEYANGNTNEWPFWNELNGPLADALWHTGQLVLLRRMADNPFNAKVNVLTGTVGK